MKKIVIIISIFMLFNSLLGIKSNKIHVTKITSSSTLHPSSHKYSVKNIYDKTLLAWVEGKKGNGIGEYVKFQFKKDIKLSYFYIKNGYGHFNYFKKNNRVKRMKISNSKGFHTIVTIRDSFDIQKVILPKLILGNNLKFEILSVYPGTHYEDTCITEISFIKPKRTKPLVFGHVNDFYDPSKGLNGTKYGYFDKLYGIVIKKQFSLARPFYGNYSIVFKNSNYYCINQSGAELFKLPNGEIPTIIQNNILKIFMPKHTIKNSIKIKKYSINGNLLYTGYENFERTESIEDSYIYQYYPELSNSWYHHQFNGRIHDINKTKFNNGLIGFKRNSKWGFKNKYGKVIVKNIFDDIHAFNNNYAAVKINKKWGFINKSGYFIIKPQYTYAISYSEGLFLVGKKITKKNNDPEANTISWGYINKFNKIIIPFKFSYAMNFKNGITFVAEKIKIEGICRCHQYIFFIDTGYINKHGVYLWREKKY